MGKQKTPAPKPKTTPTPNLPSKKEGQKSGKGRDNNPPKPKK